MINDDKNQKRNLLKSIIFKAVENLQKAFCNDLAEFAF